MAKHYHPRPSRGRRRLSAAIVGCAVAIGIVGCGVAAPGVTSPGVEGPDVTGPGSAGSADSGGNASATAPTDSNGMRPGVFPTTRVDPPSGARPDDGATVTPDDDLDAAQLAALIRLPASAPPAPRRCTPEDVGLSLYGFDAAAGHRYSAVLAENVGDRTCTLLGWPGLGFRGEIGTAFALVADRDPTPSDRVGAVLHDPIVPVELRPGDKATADIEWTGSLAGAYDERVSLVAVQLVAGGPVGSIVVPGDDPVDIGEGTTVRVRQWNPAAPPAP